MLTMLRRDPARDMLLGLADQHGLGDEIAKLLKGRRRPRRQVLSCLLKQRRRELGWNVDKIHERTNLSRSQIAGLETGRHTTPGLRTVQALSYGYRISFAALIVAVLEEQDARTRCANDR